MAEIKFCGMMRPEDAKSAATLGARYVGVILAEGGGPRTLTDATARVVLEAVPSHVNSVGVFGPTTARDVATRAQRLQLDVVQLHGDPDPQTIDALRRMYTGDVWAVVRVSGTALPEHTAQLFDVADGVVLDARVPGKLGGSGVALPWAELREALAQARKSGEARVILAGGLNAENVARAIEILRPDVVDVSSGVESRVGIKDPEKMRAFQQAVQRAQVERGASVR